MYICLKCHTTFENPEVLTETHGLSSPPYEHFGVCPVCKSTNFKLKEVKYCHCCGAKLNACQDKYCSTDCEIKGKKLKLKELKRRNLLYQSYIYNTVREVEEYNHKNNTRLSYGQYVALINNSKKGKHKNGKR